MKDITNEEIFIAAIARINRYLIAMSAFFLLYFLFRTKVDMFLFLLALSYAAFALLSHKHLITTNRLAAELRRAMTSLEDVTEEISEIHPY
jgi:hypothetical protein